LKSSQKNVKNVPSKALEVTDDIFQESDSDEDDEILLLTKKRGNYKSRRFKSKEGKKLKTGLYAMDARCQDT